ncbi:MAG: hypothetical protein ACI9R3_006449 [Verrucomicrobiales bacterium]|jgi:hypothetical protein
MAGIQNRTAAELKAELTAAIEQSRALLANAVTSAEADAYFDDETVDDEAVDQLTGLELSFDDAADAAAVSDSDVPAIDFSGLSDAELEIVLNETAPEKRQNEPLPLMEELKSNIARSPLPWALGALAIGAFGARTLLADEKLPKNHLQKASQSGDSPITHGSLVGQIMKTGFEMVQPSLHEAVHAWLARFVEKKP